MRNRERVNLEASTVKIDAGSIDDEAEEAEAGNNNDEAQTLNKGLKQGHFVYHFDIGSRSRPYQSELKCTYKPGEVVV